MRKRMTFYFTSDRKLVSYLRKVKPERYSVAYHRAPGQKELIELTVTKIIH